MTNKKHEQGVGSIDDNGNYVTLDDYYSVCIATNHHGEYPIFENTNNRIVYDGWEYSGVIEDMGFDEEQVEEYLNKIFEARKKRGQIYALWVDPELFATYFELRGRKESFIKWIEETGEYIKQEANNGVGGDDSKYDYFPDLLDIFAQACYAFDLKDYCSKILSSQEMQKAYNGTHPDDDWKVLHDDCLGYWEN